MNNLYIITIQLEDRPVWDYKANQKIQIPVWAKNEFFAEEKLLNTHCGSEYPEYKITSTIKCDNGLFQPILKK
jgi:hypothetical protein